MVSEGVFQDSIRQNVTGHPLADFPQGRVGMDHSRQGRQGNPAIEGRHPFAQKLSCVGAEDLYPERPLFGIQNQFDLTDPCLLRKAPVVAGKGL